MYSIGELARASGVKVPTIRYYETIGLIEAPGRTEGNQRRYEEEALERLSFVRHAREMGFGLDAVRDLIELGRHPEWPCDRADSIAAEQLAATRRRIARLKRLELELNRVVEGCEGGNVGKCYVMRALGDHDLCEAEHGGPV